MKIQTMAVELSKLNCVFRLLIHQSAVHDTHKICRGFSFMAHGEWTSHSKDIFVALVCYFDCPFVSSQESLFVTSPEAMKGHFTLSFPLPARKVSYASRIHVLPPSPCLHFHVCHQLITTHRFRCYILCIPAGLLTPALRDLLGFFIFLANAKDFH